MTAPFATATLIQGPEALLAERAVHDVVSRATHVHPDATVSRVPAAGLDRGGLAEVTGASLFSSAAIAVIEAIADLPAELADTVVGLVQQPSDDLALVLVHDGGNKGRALLDRIRKAGAEVVEAPAVKPWELPQFAVAEARRRGGRIDRAAAEALVGAVGSDLRAVAAGVWQLIDDSPELAISVADVHRYFAGRAEVSGFAVADQCLDGNREAAMASLRWALETGVAPVLLTSAVASALRNLGRYLGARDELSSGELAKRVGVPPWKLKDLARQSRGWNSATVAEAIGLAATADAQVKGAAGDPGYALDLLVLRVIECRGRSRRPASARS